MHFYFHYKNSYKFENDFMERKKISFNKFNYKKREKKIEIQPLEIVNRK